ncbi:MAG TPA: hypothetical protein PK156_09110, partial [Polyangium sp.]|nr:hypothetical protein [Polyangium sp.]
KQRWTRRRHLGSNHETKLYGVLQKMAGTRNRDHFAARSNVQGIIAGDEFTVMTLRRKEKSARGSLERR